MGAMASQITGVSIVCSTLCSGADQRKHQSSTQLAFVRGNHRWPVDSPHKGPVPRKMFPFDDFIKCTGSNKIQDSRSLLAYLGSMSFSPTDKTTHKAETQNTYESISNVKRNTIWRNAIHTNRNICTKYYQGYWSRYKSFVPVNPI